MARYRRNEEALAAKNEKLLAEVTRLQALVTPVNDNGDDEPDDPNGSAAPAEPHEPIPTRLIQSRLRMNQRMSRNSGSARLATC